MATNDLRYTDLRNQGLSGSLNEMLMTYYRSAGAVGNTFNELEYSWLGVMGATGFTLTERWYNYLRGLGYSGTIQDMLYAGAVAGTLLAFDPASLFKNNEAGLWYEPGLNNTVFQDSAGTTPGAAGLPAGRVLDKRLGLVRGPELALALSAAGWTVFGQDATHIATFSGGTLRYQSDTTSPQLNVSVADQFVVGKSYEVVIIIAGGGTGLLKTDAGTSVPQFPPGVTRFIFNPTSPTFNLTRGTSAVDLTVTNISVRELPGSHATQATAAARPVLSDSPPSLVYDGIDDGLSTASFPVGTLGSNMDCFIAVKRGNEGLASVLNSASGGLLVYDAGATAGGQNTFGAGASVTTYINGAVIGATRGQLLTALPLNSWAVAEVRNIDMSAWASFYTSRNGAGGASFTGSTGPIVLCLAQSDANRTKIREYVAKAVGVTLS